MANDLKRKIIGFSGFALGIVLVVATVIVMLSQPGAVPVVYIGDDNPSSATSTTKGDDSIVTQPIESVEPTSSQEDSSTDTSAATNRPGNNPGSQGGGTTSTTSNGSGQTTPPTKVKTIKAQVKNLNGVPRLYINGNLRAANMLFVNTDIRNDDIYASEIKHTANGGIHMYTIINNLSFSTVANQELKFANLRGAMDLVVKNDPKAELLLRVNVGQFYTKNVPDSEVMHFVGGEEKTFKLVSLASDTWFDDAKAQLKEQVEYIRSHADYADHVYGYHLECSEWFQYAYREAGADISPANDRKFREWLTAKYKTDAALQQAWGSGYTLAKAEVPRDLPDNISGAGHSHNLLLQAGETRFADYFDYINDLVASRIEGLAKVIKDTTNNENVVIAFYGYYFDLYDAQSGHFDFRKLLESPYLDGFASPVTYSDRSGSSSSAAATSGYMTAVDSVVRAGKLWVMESDQRTFINRTENPNDTFCPPIPTINKIQTVHKREIGTCMVHGTAMYAMDLSGLGWLDDANIWRNIGRLTTTNLAYIQAQKSPATYDVALVVDEKAESLVGTPGGLSSTTLSQMRFNMYRAGVRFALVEIGDILAGRADDYKVYIFANPYRLSADTVNKLNDKLHRDDKMSVFLYNFGNTAAADVKKLTGMDIVNKMESMNHRITISQSEIPGLPKTSNGATLNPTARVTGSQTVTLGKYSDGTVGFALYKGNGYKTIFYGDTNLSTKSIRAIAQYAGVNVYMDTDDVFVANENMIVLNTSSEGNKTVQFGEKVDVYDYFENKWHTGVSSLTFTMKTEECKYLFYGKKADIEAMKLPAWK